MVSNPSLCCVTREHRTNETLCQICKQAVRKPVQQSLNALALRTHYLMNLDNYLYMQLRPYYDV